MSDAAKSVRSAADADAASIAENWGSLTWLAGGKIGNSGGLTLGRVTIDPGERNPRHMHPNSEEILYLLAGRLEHSLGDEAVTLDPGDSITIPRGAFHNAVSTGSVIADMIVAYDTADRQIVLEETT